MIIFLKVDYALSDFEFKKLSVHPFLSTKSMHPCLLKNMIHHIFQAWWYGVRLLIDEECRHLSSQRERGVYRDRGVVIKEDFLTREGALTYIYQNIKKYKNGEFEQYAFRVRSVSMAVHQNPDLYLKPGDHIQRNLDVKMFKSFLNHDGIYLGNKQVAHIYSESCANYKKSSPGKKNDARAMITSFSKFVLSEDQEVRIVVSFKLHYFNK